MKKPIVYFVFVSIIFCLQLGCSNQVSNNNGNSNTDSVKSDISKSTPVTKEKNINGSWFGNFGKSKILIVINAIENNKVSGYSILNNNKREFSGTKSDEVNGIRFILKEPGDKKGDGEFNFFINLSDSLIIGNWTMFNSKTTRDYSLSKISSFDLNNEIVKYTEKLKNLASLDKDEEFLSAFQFPICIKMVDLFAQYEDEADEPKPKKVSLQEFKNKYLKEIKADFKTKNICVSNGIDYSNQMKQCIGISEYPLLSFDVEHNILDPQNKEGNRFFVIFNQKLNIVGYSSAFIDCKK